MITAEIVPVSFVDTIWPRLSRQFTECLERSNGDCSTGDLWTWCRGGQAFLTVAIDGDDVLGAAIWRFEMRAKGVVLRNIITVGKDMETWLQAMSDLAEFIKTNGGATSLYWVGRPGWARIFPKSRIVEQTFEME